MTSDIPIIAPDLLAELPLPEWTSESSKDDYGKLLIIAGSRRLPGAAMLSARAALRSGCGTVRVAAPESVATLIGIAIPELMVVPLPETSSGTVALESLDILRDQFGPCDACVIGPGLDAHAETDDLIRHVIGACPLPLLIDAQALYAVGERNIERPNGAERILTPHPGEFAKMTGQSADELEADRDNAARRFVREHAATLVLKGRETLICAPDGQMFRNVRGTRGLGTAGSGDVLSGVIGAFLAQGLDALRAGVWGVYLHAVAGELAAQTQGDDGMMASDFLEKLPQALRELRAKK